jgi:Mg2+/Co2+ transporter CorC
MGMEQFMQALTMLPQIAEAIKKMGVDEKKKFVEHLGLEGEERDTAYEIINCFQEGKTIEKAQQKAAYQLLEKAMQINQLDLSDIIKNL